MCRNGFLRCPLFVILHCSKLAAPHIIYPGAVLDCPGAALNRHEFSQCSTHLLDFRVQRAAPAIFSSICRRCRVCRVSSTRFSMHSQKMEVPRQIGPALQWWHPRCTVVPGSESAGQIEQSSSRPGAVGPELQEAPWQPGRDRPGCVQTLGFGSPSGTAPLDWGRLHEYVDRPFTDRDCAHSLFLGGATPFSILASRCLKWRHFGLFRRTSVGALVFFLPALSLLCLMFTSL